MAKFYVQSGTLRAVVDSTDADRAALWAIHTAMDQVLPLDSSNESDEESLSEPIAKIWVALGDRIYISEMGFDRDDCLEIETFEAFQQWNQLLHAVDKLQKFLERE